MNKIWIFVEGFSEENFVKNLFWKNLYTTHKLESDIVEFVQGTNNNFINCYLWNCRSVDKIPHVINKYYYLIQQSNCDRILIVCDVEKLKCLTNRKIVIESILSTEVDKKLLYYSFSNPMIENNYWICPLNIEKVIRKQYKAKYNAELIDVNFDGYNHSQSGLKKLFKDYGIKYRETSFSEQFFGGVDDFNNCSSDLVKRVFEHIN